MTNQAWSCACGAVNQGKFCIECGRPKSAAPDGSPKLVMPSGSEGNQS